MRLLMLAGFGLVVPNGLFLHWLLTAHPSVGAVLHDELALAFILDALLATAILAAHFARVPLGRAGWGWFVALSLLGGLCFSLPFYVWLNCRVGPRAV